jgi:ankyrin repeat protein
MLDQIADGRTDLVFEFVGAGKPVSSKDSAGVSLIQWCSYYGDVSAIKFLLSKGESLDSLGELFGLHAAAFHGHAALCRFLLDNGADVNESQSDTGETGLHAAVSKTDRERFDPVLSVLLTRGANPNCETKPGVETSHFMRDCRTKGETPLHRAAAFGTEATIQMLLDAGAKVDARDMHGDTPLSWASWYLRPRPILRKLCYGQFRA